MIAIVSSPAHYPETQTVHCVTDMLCSLYVVCNAKLIDQRLFILILISCIVQWHVVVM